MLKYIKIQKSNNNRAITMKWFKWVLFGILTAGVGFWIYKLCKRDSDISLDSFVEGYTNGFSATSSPTAPKKYGQIAQEVQQKRIQSHKQINANHKEQRIKLKALINE